MSILGMYTDWYYEPADLIDEDDDQPTWPAETFTVTAVGGWWSAGPGTDTEDE